MKLSKRFAAAIIAICMLLMSFSAFAASVLIPNGLLTLPTDGSTVALTSTGLGHSNGVGIVIDTASAEALGIDITKITSSGFKTEGTSYEGIVLSGKMKIRNFIYNPNSTDSYPTKIREIMKNGDLVEFDFANVKVPRIRTNSNKTNVVFDIPYQDYMDNVVPGTAKRIAEGKITGEETEAVTFTEDDLYTLTADECAVLKALNYRKNGEADFYGDSSDVFLASNLVAKAGADYSAGIEVDTKIFPEGTIFFSANAMGPTAGGTSGLRFTGNGIGNALMSGAFIASETETYVAYGLRTIWHNNQNASRGAAATIKGVDCKFDSITSNTDDWMVGAAGKWVWDKAPNTVSLAKGDYFAVEQYNHDSYDRLAAIALVPESKVAAMDAEDAAWWRDAANVLTQEAFDYAYEATTTPYVKPAAVTATVTVNGATVETNSDAAETVVTNVALVDHRSKPIEVVTLLDALVSAGFITADNAATFETTTYVTVDGLNGYDYDKWLLNGGEKIVATTPEKIDVTNFSPVPLSLVMNTMGGTGGLGEIKLVFNQTGLNSSVLKFCYDSSIVLGKDENGKDQSYTLRFQDNMNGAKIAGYGVLTTPSIKNIKADDGETVNLTKGSKVYFDNETLGDLVKSGSWGYKINGKTRLWNDTILPGAVKMPDGTYGQHPFRICQNNSSQSNTVFYDYSNAYVMNSNTTGKLRTYFSTYDNNWVLYADGVKFVYVIKCTVDDEGILKVKSTDDAFVTFREPYSFSLEEGEKALIWGYEPYQGAGTGGTTMVPLLTIE